MPSDTIRTQTLAALSAPGHPFRMALTATCGDDVRVCDLDDVATLPPQDFDAHAVVVVATIQSFRVEDTDQRNVYAFAEGMAPHFCGVAPSALNGLHGLPDAVVTSDDVARALAGREMLARFIGQPRWRLANWLALRRPYQIVDEAHNAKPERSFEALQRLNPALILELTAAPVPKCTNVLFHVSAQQLQAESLLKLPITLIEHTRGWQAAVYDAVQTIRSATAIEHVLGRVLRMPYATRRSRAALNRAYAHVTERETGMAANALADRLIARDCPKEAGVQEVRGDGLQTASSRPRQGDAASASARVVMPNANRACFEAASPCRGRRHARCSLAGWSV